MVVLSNPACTWYLYVVFPTFCTKTMPCHRLKQLDLTSQLLGSYHAITDGFVVLGENGTSQNGVLPEKLTVPELVYKFPAFYRSRTHHRVRNSPPLIPILGQVKPVNVMLPYFHTMQFNVIFKVQYYVSIFQCVHHSKESVPSTRLCVKFCTMLICYSVRLLPLRSSPRVEDHPLSDIRYL